MKTLVPKLRFLYKSILSSITFFPSLIFILFAVSAVCITHLEQNLGSEFLNSRLNFLQVTSMDSARAILTTLIGGTISLMVFSFSMVMIILNQASSNYTPRLLPGLVSDKKNQFVLGYYLGSIVFNIIVLISLNPPAEGTPLKLLSILCGIILGITSLVVFIFFIHAVSTSIQIDNLLNSVFTKAKARLKLLIEQGKKNNEKFEENTDSWNVILNDKSGYYHGFNRADALEIVKKFDTDLQIISYKGQFLLKGMELAKSRKKLSLEQEKNLLELVRFNDTGDIEDNYVLGLKQIAEVGVKAMSPGINDPGTAISTIDYLTDLLAHRMLLTDEEIYEDQQTGNKVSFNTISFNDLIFQIFTSYRQYCKHDTLIMQKLILSIRHLMLSEMKVDSYQKVLEDQLKMLQEDCKEAISNSYDLAAIDKMLKF